MLLQQEEQEVQSPVSALWFVLLRTLVVLIYVAVAYYSFFVRDPRRRAAHVVPGDCAHRRLAEGFAANNTDTNTNTTKDDEAGVWGENPPTTLTCIVSTVDGEKYCVRDREERTMQRAVDLLARVTGNMQRFVDALRAKYPDDEDVARLHRNFDRGAVAEILPNSTFEAVTTNKGEQVEFCLLRSKSDTERLIDEHTLTFVALHEVSHIMCPEEGHTDLFWRIFRFLLKEAKDMGVHEPRDYARSPAKYCDRTINDSPFFQWQQKHERSSTPAS